MCKVKKEIIIQALEKALELCRKQDVIPIDDKHNNIILALYNGNLYPAEDMAHRTSQIHQELSKATLEVEEQLKDIVGESNEFLVEDLVKYYICLNDEQSNECYLEGFQNAIQFIFTGLSPQYEE